MPLQSTFNRLSLRWKLSMCAIGVMVLVLCTAMAFVSAKVWRDASEQGTNTLHDAAAATSSLVQVYDDMARKAALKDFGNFKAEFDATFTLDEAAGADGKPRAQLANKGQIVNDNFEVVDRFTQVSGAAATIFARTGDDFRRITTSLKKQDGSRAIGTLLDRHHPAYQAMLDGKPFTGMATLFGKTYMTRYEPIREGDRTIGILFVGSDMTDVLEALREAMLTQRPFSVGAVYAIDTRPGASFGRVFGVEQVQQLDDKNAWPTAFMKRVQAAGESGSFDSVGSLRPAADTTDVQRVAVVKNPAWNWVIVSEAPVTSIMDKTQQILAVLWGASLTALMALLVMIIWLTQRLVGQPVGQLCHALTHLADGDLSQAMESRSGNELGKLTESMEGFRAHLVATLAIVRGNADSVATASAQIAQGNQDLSLRTEEQAAALQQTAATMQQLDSTIRNNSDNARQANQLALSASGVATQGGEVVEQVVETMKGINASSKKIADITSVIDGIAFQTNILALNASVEAARAGEQGRGFAVVAGEVRRLAQRSAEAAKEIKALISDSVDQVEQGTALVDRAGRTMQEIVGAIQRVSHIVAEISEASAEQSSGIGQVGHAVAQMDQATQQNAALVEQSAAAATSLTHQARRLVQAVAVFKLNPNEVSVAAVAA